MNEDEGNEVEIIGRARLREPTKKTPIGEVRSYQKPKVINGTFEDGTTYTIGGDDLEFWLSLPDDFESD